MPGAGPGDGRDLDLPGFGPFGTAGRTVSTAGGGTAGVRARFPVLRAGRQYLRGISVFGEPFAGSAPGEIVAWSRILVDEEALCVLNPNGVAARGADVIVDAGLNPSGSSLTVLLNTARAAGQSSGPAVGDRLPVQRRPDGTAYVAVRDLGPSEVLVVTNRP